MAKCILTLEDKDDGTVTLRCELDPPIDVDGEFTVAQSIFTALLGWLSDNSQQVGPVEVHPGTTDEATP